MQHAVKEFFHHLPEKFHITGQKHQKRYTIQRKFTNSLQTATYLCQCNGKDVVIKIGKPTDTFTKEVNHLRAINKVQGKPLGPSLLDVDYWQTDNGEVFLFYVTKYKKGVNLQTFFKQYKRHWIPLFICQLLDKLVAIHNAGFVLEKLTPEQLLVTKLDDIYFSHVKGIVREGDYLQQQSCFYDQNFWTSSGRKAQPSNNLFSVVMVVLHIYYPQKFARTNCPKSQLIKKIDELPLSVHYKQCFLKAALGRYETAAQMKSEFIKAIYLTEDIRYLPNYKRQTSMGEATIILLFSVSSFIGANFFL